MIFCLIFFLYVFNNLIEWNALCVYNVYKNDFKENLCRYYNTQLTEYNFTIKVIVTTHCLKVLINTFHIDQNKVISTLKKQRFYINVIVQNNLIAY